jgi:hypothetical protein
MVFPAEGMESFLFPQGVRYKSVAGPAGSMEVWRNEQRGFVLLNAEFVDFARMYFSITNVVEDLQNILAENVNFECSEQYQRLNPNNRNHFGTLQGCESIYVGIGGFNALYPEI